MVPNSDNLTKKLSEQTALDNHSGDFNIFCHNYLHISGTDGSINFMTMNIILLLGINHLA